MQKAQAKILLVEDYVMTQDLITMLLERNGFNQRSKTIFINFIDILDMWQLALNNLNGFK